MAKKKQFIKTDTSIPEVEHSRNPAGLVILTKDRIPPRKTTVEFPTNPSCVRTFNFGPWYGFGIDTITYACQQQVERFLQKQDTQSEPRTVVAYCDGLKQFLDHMVMIRSALQRDLDLGDIDRSCIDSFLAHLSDQGLSTTSQKTYYAHTKPVLLALGRRGLINLVDVGDHATFPLNPFPGVCQKYIGQMPLSLAERKAFTAAVKTAVLPLLTQDTEPSGEILAYALLIVALHTGRNTTPLLELQVNCMRDHPKGQTVFLVVHKRRGHTTSKTALRGEVKINKVIESTPTLRPTVLQLIRRAISLTESFRRDAPAELKDRVWLYRTRSSGEITALSGVMLGQAITNLVKNYGLVDRDGNQLVVNVSRLRKTFINRIYELLDGDVGATAIAAGNTPRVTAQHYLRPSEDAKRNWRFMGEILVQELLTKKLGSTSRTPLGNCTDPRSGEYAPKRGNQVCTSFLNCLRCRNYVVTGDDLWRLFSFYFRVLREQPKVDHRRWRQQMAHIPRLIERDVIAAGLKRGVLKKSQVDAARARARADPHPFWASDSIMNEFQTLPTWANVPA